MCAHPTLVGYIEQHCRAMLAVAQLEKNDRGEIPPAMIDLLHELRDQYNEAIDAEDGEMEDGDTEIFAQFKMVLNEIPRQEPLGRPFSRRGNLKMGETPSGGTLIYHRRH